MIRNIEVDRQIIDGVDLTFVTQPGEQAIRACVVLPFVSSDCMPGGKYKEETPHLLEHVVCGGDGSMPPGKFKEMMEKHGGYTNAFTSKEVNGKLAFETTQPDHGVKLVETMIASVFSPALDPDDVEAQRAVVRNELNGYTLDPERARYSEMLYAQGERYTTDMISLAGLDDISRPDIIRFHDPLAVKDNTRIVISCDPELVPGMRRKVQSLMAQVPTGQKTYYADTEITQLPDYHVEASEIPDGMTEYSQKSVVNGNVLGDFDLPEARVVISAIREYINSGPEGIHEQSRSAGLSYGIAVSVIHTSLQLALSFGDRTKVEHTSRQIDLVKSRLERALEFKSEDCIPLLNKLIGRDKVAPQRLLNFANTVEAHVGKERYEVVTPLEINAALSSMSPAEIVSGVRKTAAALLEPTFVNRHSFGSNPF